MISYPISFYGESMTKPGIESPWLTRASGFEGTCSIPTSFEGPGTDLSPEDYFLLAIKNCFVATFKVYAAYSSLSYRQLHVTAELVVDKNDLGRPVMSSVRLNVELYHPSDLKKAQKIFDKAMASGPILCSVKTQIQSQLQIISGDLP